MKPCGCEIYQTCEICKPKSSSQQPTPSATPRTDANELENRHLNSGIMNLCDVNFARTLERENQALQQQITQLTLDIAEIRRQHSEEQCDEELIKENQELRALINQSAIGIVKDKEEWVAQILELQAKLECAEAAVGENCKTISARDNIINELRQVAGGLAEATKGYNTTAVDYSDWQNKMEKAISAWNKLSK